TPEETAEILAAIDHVAQSTPPLEQFPPVLRAAITAGDRAGAASLAGARTTTATRDIAGRLETANQNVMRGVLAPEVAASLADNPQRLDAAAAAVEATLAAAREAGATRLECAVAATAAVAGKYGVPPIGVAALVGPAVAPPATGPGRAPRNAPS